VAAKHPQEEHVAQQVRPAAVQEHRGEQREPQWGRCARIDGAARRVLTGHERVVKNERVELPSALSPNRQLIQEGEDSGGDQAIVGPRRDLQRLVVLRGRVGEQCGGPFHFCRRFLHAGGS
jgi:hypothetical protein